jgi:hypothetical protein
MRKRNLIVLPLLALAACQGEQPQSSEAPSGTAAPATATTAGESTEPALAGCAPVKLALSPARFAENRAAFAEGQLGWTKLSASFVTAYAAACEAGWLAKKPLVDPRASSQDTLFVANAPQANAAAIYFDADKPAKEMVIEGPFVDGEGHVQVPGAGAIKEAIYCYAVGASAKEQEESGRCLVD